MNDQGGETNYQVALCDYLVKSYIVCVIYFRLEYTQLGNTKQLDETIRQGNDKEFHVTALCGEGEWKTMQKNTAMEELIRGSALVTIFHHGKKPEKIRQRNT